MLGGVVCGDASCWLEKARVGSPVDGSGVGVLAKVFPPEVIDAAVADCGRVEQRSRALLARAVAYFAMGMALHAGGSYEDVLGCMTDGLAWASRGEAPVRLATKAAISHARDRLGSEPLALHGPRLDQLLQRPISVHPRTTPTREPPTLHSGAAAGVQGQMDQGGVSRWTSPIAIWPLEPIAAHRPTLCRLASVGASAQAT